jgi:glutamate synthase domain-containing protein 2
MIMVWLKNIRDRTLSPKAPVISGRSNKVGKIDFDDIIFVPAQLTKRPVDYFRERIESKTVIGKSSKRPLELDTPIFFAAMSFGALSKEAKIAIAKASTILGTATNTGEGGMLPEERKYARFLISQYSTGRFGVDDKYLKSADAIEIKIGQGAKPGQGGLLPGHKVTEEIAKVRKIPRGKPVHSPPFHPDKHPKT